MLKRLVVLAGIAAVFGAAIFWLLTMPSSLDAERLAQLGEGDPDKGKLVFYAGGCGSCHADKGAKGPAKLLLGGRHPLETPFGTFYAPNISPSKENGIGSWTQAEFANAMINGVAPDGSHYYPAFPFASYSRMSTQDISDLFAYIKTLKPVEVSNLEHDLPIFFKLRRGLGMWKLLFASSAPIADVDASDPVIARGQYLVEGLGHCGECHTPRNILGGIDAARWLAGGPSPEGKGKIPNITPHKSGIGDWTLTDIAYSLESGFTPSFDSFGASMVSVQENMAELPASDREAIAKYLKAVQPVASEK